MRKRTKQHGLSMLAGLLMMAMLAGWMLSGPFEVEAVDVTEVRNETEWNTAISNGGTTVNIKLMENISLSQTCTWSNGSMTIDLNGHTLSSESNSGVLQLNSGTLTITDSSEGNGTITSSLDFVDTIQTTGGTLNINGGSIQSGSYTAVNADSNSNVNINGGHLTGAHSALSIGTNCKVTIGGKGGNPYLQSSSSNSNSNSTIVMQPSVSSGDTTASELVIQGGNFVANTSNTFCYVCNVSGVNNKLTISGGTFTLNAKSGSTLVIGKDMLDSNVSISGGTYNGRIARMIEGTTWDYSVYYGGKTTEGIIASGYVLTDNYLTNITNTKEEPTVFTSNQVSVVPGSLIKFDTRCSSLTTSSGDEKTADLFSINPVSVGKDGTVYANSNANETPPTVGGDSSGGNTYTFHHWIDSNNRAYSSSTDYLAQNSMAGSMGNHVTLYAVWKANCSKPEGLQSASNCSVVSEVTGSFNLNNGTKYELGKGSWTVTGDNTVYSGEQSFYVTESGNYGFQRR